MEPQFPGTTSTARVTTSPLKTPVEPATLNIGIESAGGEQDAALKYTSAGDACASGICNNAGNNASRCLRVRKRGKSTPEPK